MTALGSETTIDEDSIAFLWNVGCVNELVTEEPCCSHLVGELGLTLFDMGVDLVNFLLDLGNLASLLVNCDLGIVVLYEDFIILAALLRVLVLVVIDFVRNVLQAGSDIDDLNADGFDCNKHVRLKVNPTDVILLRNEGRIPVEGVCLL